MERREEGEGRKMEREQDIRQIAYGLWEAEGRPEGRALEHWVRAAQMVNAEVSSRVQAPPPAAVPAPSSPIKARSGRGKGGTKRSR